MTARSPFRGRVIAVDWSGAKSPKAQHDTIRAAVVRDGTSWELSGGRTREETMRSVVECDGPVLAGFDFSFGFPAWFARAHGCASIADVWELTAREGDGWLRPEPPFWRSRCEVPVERRFRACEVRLRAAGFPAKSIFQLVGNGQVGAGSVRGMPLLARLRAEGFTIWPFERASERTVFEIYPTVMRTLVDLGDDFATTHDRDAASAGMAMWRYRDDMAALEATTDPVTLLEGDVWTPPVV